MYFNKTSLDWRISQCCQFHDKKLAKQYNFGTTTKTYALKADGKQRVQTKALENCKKLVEVMKYFSTQPKNLRSFRISSELLPCYTLDFTEDWYKETMPQISQLLHKAGNIAKKHEIRLSVHPGQYTVLASNNTEVVKNSVKDLEYHALYGSLMNLEPEDFVINIHLQGLYGGKHEDGIKRFASHYNYLSEYTQRALAVENEDKHRSGYDIEHTLELSQHIPIRCTLDIHHYECFRQKENYITHTNNYFKEAVKTWKHTRPLFHVSHTKIDNKGNDVSRMSQHSDMLHDLERLSIMIPMLEYADFDIEAKNKEEAVLHAYKYIKEEEHYVGESLKCKNLI